MNVKQTPSNHPFYSLAL